MPAPRSLNPRSLVRASLALARSDAALGELRARRGPPPLWPREPGLPALILFVLEQQVSLASAQAAFDKLVATVGEPTPRKLLALDEAALRAVGFSRQKSRYARGIAQALLDGALDLEALAGLPDDEARAALCALDGIGPWTADVYLLRCLNRPDVWPAGDLALQIAAQELLALPGRPGATELIEIGERWRPWRAVAARMLWQHYLAR